MKKRTLALWSEYGLTAIKYLLALFMILAGVLTATGPLTPADGSLGFIYAHRAALVSFGVIFVFSGGCLLYGKLRRSRKWVGRGLMYIYLCFLFATVLNMLAWGIYAPAAWGGNFLMSIIVGILYLRWRFQTEYVNPEHFTRDLEYHSPKGDE